VSMITLIKKFRLRNVMKEKNNDDGLQQETRLLPEGTDLKTLGNDAEVQEYNFSRSVLDSLTVPFFMFDTGQMNFFRWNKAFCDVTGYSNEEIVCIKPSDLIPDFEQ